MATSYDPFLVASLVSHYFRADLKNEKEKNKVFRIRHFQVLVLLKAHKIYGSALTSFFSEINDCIWNLTLQSISTWEKPIFIISILLQPLSHNFVKQVMIWFCWLPHRLKMTAPRAS